MFRVEWLRDAVNELADIWIKADSPQRQEITKAARTLDKELESDPFRKSESREADTRISLARPLGILFEVDSRLGVVWILHVWSVHRDKT